MSRSRQGMWAYLSLFVFWAAIPFMHIKSWTALVSFYGLLAHTESLIHEPWLPRVLEIEETERAQRSLKRRLDNARLGAFKPIADTLAELDLSDVEFTHFGLDQLNPFIHVRHHTWTPAAGKTHIVVFKF